MTDKLSSKETMVFSEISKMRVIAHQIVSVCFDGGSEYLGWARLVTTASGGGSSGTATLFRVERATENVFADGVYYCGLSGSSCHCKLGVGWSKLSMRKAV